MPSTASRENFRKVESILISQPKPERSPYFRLEEKYRLKIDFRQFIHVEEVAEKEFRKQRIKCDDFQCVIFSSKNSIENFFRLCDATRVKMSSETRWFCLTKAVANYLQKFIVYRKRKVFVGSRRIDELATYLEKYKDKKFLVPCSNLGAKPIMNYMKENGYNFTESMMYRTVASDLSDLADITYDVLVFFSPLGIESLYENFPDFKQNNTRIAVFGKSTSQAVLDRGLTINIEAPAPETPSMTMALENYLQKSNK